MHLFRDMGSCLAGMTMLVAIGAGSAHAQEAPEDLHLSVRLAGGLVQLPKEGEPQPRAVNLQFERVDGAWQQVVGSAPTFNRAAHRGYVADATVSEDHLELEIRMVIGGDPWIPGGPAEYDIALPWDDLERGERVEGSYTGRFRDVEVRGEAEARSIAPPPAPAEGFRPVEGEEYPRMMFRSEDLDELREKAEQTAVGRRAMEQMRASKDDPVARGMLYQITGDASFAEQARPLVDELIAKGGEPASFNLPHAVGERTAAIAMTFDLCYDAWPEDYRQRVRNHLHHYSARTILRPQFLSRKMNWSPASNYQAAVRSGGGMAGLALWGLPGGEPDEPAEPDYDEAESAAERELMEREHKIEQVLWEQQRQRWERNGFDQRHMHMFRLGETEMSRFFRYAMGEGGWQAEGEKYTSFSFPTALAYAHAYHTMFGRSVNREQDVALFAPRYVMQGIFFPGEDRKPITQSDSISDGTLGHQHYARVFSATAPEYQPAVLWRWNQVLGLGDTAGESVAESERLQKAFARASIGKGQDAVFTLLNYPVQMEARHPEEVMPRTWEAPARGGYIFRNGWRAEDTIVAQVYLKSLPTDGWNHPNAGTFRIAGLGHVWAGRSPHAPKGGDRWHENVVMLPEDPINFRAGSHVQAYDAHEDGSGVVSTNMDDVYHGRKMTDEGEPMDLHDSEFRWLRENFEDLGIRGVRSFGADYSGASGAPGLFVVADRIEGGGGKAWLFHLDGAIKDDAVELHDNGFTITQGEASLRATFVAPKTVDVERISSTSELPFDLHEQYEHQDLRAIAATGGDSYFVVMTLQRGEAPAVEVEGEGLDAAARVGNQTVRFDDDRIVFETME